MTDRRKKTAAAGETGAATLDIPHEEIPNNNTGPVLIGSVVTVDQQIKQELAKFSLPDAAIAQLKETYGALVINGQDDKDGYKAVRAAWGEVRTKRTGLEKKGLELRNQYKVITTAIGKEEDRLIELLKPLEDELFKKWKAIDDEKERVKKEQEEKEQQQLMARVEEIQGLGMKFKDGFYQIGDTITVDVATLRGLSDDTYGKLKTAITNKAAEIKKAEEELAEKKRQEQEQLKQQQEQLKQQQEQLQQQQRQLEEQKQEMAKQLRGLRLSKLQGIGMELHTQGNIEVVQYESVRLYLAPLIDMTADEFNSVLETTTQQIKNLKDQEAQRQQEEKQKQQALEAKKQFIGKAMETAGLRYIYTAQSFVWEDRLHAIELKFSELIPLSEEDITLKAQKASEDISNAKLVTKTEDEKLKAAQEKEQKLAMTDKQRWEREVTQLETQILRIIPGEYKTKTYQQKAQKLLERITNLMNEFKP